MDIIDENGNLFGRVNVVDALVVLVVLAIAATGAALVLSDDGSDSTPTATVNATPDFGTQPAFVVNAIDEGDTYSPTDTTQLTITDVYTTPTDSGTRVVTRVSLTGERAGDTIDYDGAPPCLGRTLNVVTGEYQVSGELRALGSGRELTTGTTTVLIRDVLPEGDATALDPGDSVTVAGQRAATVENVTVQPTTNPTQRLVYATVNLSTLDRDGIARFGGRQVRPGRTIRLVASDFTLDGQIKAINEAPRVSVESVVLRTRIPAERARQIAPGDTVSVADQTVATVDARRVYPTGDPDEQVVFHLVQQAEKRPDGVRFSDTDHDHCRIRFGG